MPSSLTSHKLVITEEAPATCKERAQHNLNPFPRNLAQIVTRYDQILVPELNGGQLTFVLRGKFALDIVSLAKLYARPFRINEIEAKIAELLKK